MSEINLDTYRYNLELDDESFSKGMEDAEKQVKEFKAEMNKFSSFLKTSFFSGFIKAAESGLDLKEVLKDLKVTTNETTQEFTRMTQSLMNMSNNSSQNFTAIIEGFNNIREAARQANEDMDAVITRLENAVGSNQKTYESIVGGVKNNIEENSSGLNTLTDHLMEFASITLGTDSFSEMAVKGTKGAIQTVSKEMTSMILKTGATALQTTALSTGIGVGLSFLVFEVAKSLEAYNDKLEENRLRKVRTKAATDNLKIAMNQFQESLDVNSIANVRQKLDEVAETIGYTEAVARKAELTMQLDDIPSGGYGGFLLNHISQEIKQLDERIKEYEAIEKSTIDQIRSQYKSDTLSTDEFVSKSKAVKKQIDELKKLNQVENITVSQQAHLSVMVSELKRNLLALGMSEEAVNSVISETGDLYNDNMDTLDNYMTKLDESVKNKKLKYIEELQAERAKHEATRKMLMAELTLRQKNNSNNSVFSNLEGNEKSISYKKTISPYFIFDDLALTEFKLKEEQAIAKFDSEIEALIKDIESADTEKSIDTGSKIKDIETKQNKYQSYLDRIADSQHKINLLKAKANSLDDEADSVQKIDLLTNIQEELASEKKYLEELNKSRREDLAGLKEGSDAYRELQNEIRNTSLEWWHLDEEQRNIIESTQEINDAVEELAKEKLRKIADTESKIVEIYEREGEEKLKIIQEEYDAELEELEKHHDKKQNEYDKDLDNYKKHIQSQIDALNEASEKEDFDKSLAEKQEELNEIQMKINELSLVTGDNESARTALLEKAELENEFEEKQEEIDEFVADRNKNLKIEALEESLADYEEYIESQKSVADSEFEHKKQLLDKELQNKTEILEAEYSKEKLYSKARKMLLSGEYDELTTMFMDYQKKTGEGWSSLGDTIKDDFVSQLERAKELIEEFEERDIEIDIDSGDSDNGSAKMKSHTTLGGGFEDMTDKEFKEYKQNKKDYEKGKNQEKAAKRNQELRDTYGIENDDYSYEDLKNYYHEGGWVTSFKNRLFNNLRSDEVPAILQTGEFVLSRDMINQISNKNYTATQQPNVITIGSLMEFSGSVDNTSRPMIQTIAENSLKKLESMLEKNGLHTEVKGLRI